MTCLSLLNTQSNKTYRVTVKGIGSVEYWITRFVRALLYFLTFGCCFKGKFYNIKDASSNTRCWVHSSDINAAYRVVVRAFSHCHFSLNDSLEPQKIPKDNLPIHPTEADEPLTSKALMKKSFVMPKKVGVVSTLGSYLTPVSKYLYIDKEQTRLFFFPTPSNSEVILVPKFLFDIIPPGIYTTIYGTTDRIAEKTDLDTYQALAELIGVDPTEKNGVIDLIMAHYAQTWNLISNPKSVTRPYFQPSRTCQILFQDKDKEGAWEELCFNTSKNQDHRMSETITKFTGTWIADSEKQANKRRIEAVRRAITKIQQASSLPIERRSLIFPAKLGDLYTSSLRT